MPDKVESQTLSARWVFPVCRAPLERGTVTIAQDRIVAVEPHGRRAADLDLGNVAILPGLVNAHTHLDLSGMRGLASPTPDFTDWLRKVIAHRRSRSTEQIQGDIHLGLAESIRAGTTLIGDISAGGATWEILAQASLRAVVFFEMLGLTKERASQSLKEAQSWLEAHSPLTFCRPGLSPHAPYSVRWSLFVKAALLVRSPKRPLAVHLAESLAELELLHHCRGPFVAFLKELGIWDPEGIADSPKAVMSGCDQREPKLFIHCNYLAPSARVPRNSTVVYCPRTHAAFGHSPHPFRDFLKRGVRVALGTDSLASNPDLDVLAEARFVHERHPELPGEVLLRMATLSGAEALGWADETGSLEPGKSADLIVLPLPDVESADPHRLVLESSLSVRSVLWCGRWVYPE